MQGKLTQMVNIWNKLSGKVISKQRLQQSSSDTLDSFLEQKWM